MDERVKKKWTTILFECFQKLSIGSITAEPHKPQAEVVRRFSTFDRDSLSSFQPKDYTERARPETSSKETSFRSKSKNKSSLVDRYANGVSKDEVSNVAQNYSENNITSSIYQNGETCHEPYYAPASQVDRGHGGRLEAGLVLPVYQVCQDKREEEQR